MLLVVAPVPRLDRVQFVERLDVDAPGARRAYAAHFEAGGHGLVAMRSARALGLEARILACHGGATGEILANGLREERLEAAWVPIASPTPMGVVHCGCDATGGGARRSWIESEPVLGDAELCRLLARFDEELARAETVLFVEPATTGPLGVALLEIARRAREHGVPFFVVSDELCGEMLAIGPDVVLESRGFRTGSTGEPGGAAGAPPPRDECRARARLSCDAHGRTYLQLPEHALEIEVPRAPDRGGDAPFEAAAVAWMIKDREAWPTRTAACWAVAAATAQRLKEFGGRLARSEVDGFFARIRARESETTA